MYNKGQMAKAVLFFAAAMLAMTVLVFLYIFLSGGGPTGSSYLSFYYPLAVLALVLAAGAASGRKRGDR